MSAARITRIVEVTNRLEADLVVLLGDYVHGIWKGLRRIVPARDWGRALSGLEAPLGVYAVLGNHDWEVDGEGTRAALETNARRPCATKMAGFVAPKMRQTPVAVGDKGGQHRRDEL